MPKGQSLGWVQVELLNSLLEHELADLPAEEKEEGLSTNELAAKAFGTKVAEPQRISVSRALNQLFREGRVIKLLKPRYRNVSRWRLHPLILIPPRRPKG